MTKRKQHQADDGSKPKRPYRERRVKFFDCIGPNHKGARRSQSLKKRFAVAQLCRKCRKGVDINPNQTSLFTVVPEATFGLTPEAIASDAAKNQLPSNL